MSNTYVLSARAACSYIWNQGIDRQDSCPVNLANSIKAFITALFSDYTVTKAEIDNSSLIEGDHKHSIFSKEYRKLSSYTSKPASASTIDTSTEITDDLSEALEKKKYDIKQTLHKMRAEYLPLKYFLDCAYNRGFRKDTRYETIQETLILDNTKQKKLVLPKYLIVFGNVVINGEIDLDNFPEVFIIKGSLNVHHIPKNLSKTTIIAESVVSFANCTDMEYPPNTIFADTVVLSNCPSLATLPEKLGPNSSLDLTGCSKKIVNQFHERKKNGYPNVKLEVKKRSIFRFKK